MNEPPLGTDTIPVPMAALDWILGDDTGLSSLTIWAVMTGCTASLRAPRPPLDTYDFGRCHRLLTAVPGWRDRLNEVATCFPTWKPLVAAWTELEDLYNRSDRATLRVRMLELNAQGRAAT